MSRCECLETMLLFATGDYYADCTFCDLHMLNKFKTKSRQVLSEINHWFNFVVFQLYGKTHLGVGIDWNILDQRYWNWIIFSEAHKCISLDWTASKVLWGMFAYLTSLCYIWSWMFLWYYGSEAHHYEALSIPQ